MAELTHRRRGEYIQHLLKILEEHPEGLQAKEALQQLAKRLPPTPFESADFPNSPGDRRFEYYVRFSTIVPVKAGWMIKTKGRWTVTDDGREILHKITDPEALGDEISRFWKVWKSNHSLEEGADAAEGKQTPEEVFPSSRPTLTGSLEEAEEKAWGNVTQYLQQMNPYDFQKLVGALLRAMDYHVDWIAPPGKDEGIDIVAYTDPLGMKGPRLKVQVKRRADRVGFEELRSFLSVLGDDDRGLYVAIGGFTNDAQAKARAQEKRRITLIDLEKLFDLWIEHYEKVDEESRRLLPLKPIYFLDFET